MCKLSKKNTSQFLEESFDWPPKFVVQFILKDVQPIDLLDKFSNMKFRFTHSFFSSSSHLYVALA